MMDRRNLLASLVAGFMGMFAHVSERPRFRKAFGWFYRHGDEQGWDMFFVEGKKHGVFNPLGKAVVVSAHEAATIMQQKYGGQVFPVFTKE